MIFSLQSAKGIGWKAPPEPERKPAPKEPGIDQLDAAKRLSQGLSVKEVKHSVRQRTTAENALSTRYAASVVLDQQQSAAPPVRATAVIRQQMFHFDAEYRDQMLGPSTTVTTTAGGGLPGNALSAGVGGAPVVGGGSVYGGGLEAQQGSMVDDSYNVNEGRSVSNGRSFSGRRAGMNVIAPPRALVARDQSAPVLFTGRQQVPTAGNSQPSTHRFVAPTQRRSYSTHRDYDYAI